MTQNTVFNDARLWVFILFFSMFSVSIEIVHNIERASCELSISKTNTCKEGIGTPKKGIT